MDTLHFMVKGVIILSLTVVEDKNSRNRRKYAICESFIFEKYVVIFTSF